MNEKCNMYMCKLETKTYCASQQIDVIHEFSNDMKIGEPLKPVSFCSHIWSIIYY